MLGKRSYRGRTTNVVRYFQTAYFFGGASWPDLIDFKVSSQMWVCVYLNFKAVKYVCEVEQQRDSWLMSNEFCKERKSLRGMKLEVGCFFGRRTMGRNACRIRTRLCDLHLPI